MKEFKLIKYPNTNVICNSTTGEALYRHVAFHNGYEHWYKVEDGGILNGAYRKRKRININTNVIGLAKEEVEELIFVDAL